MATVFKICQKQSERKFFLIIKAEKKYEKFFTRINNWLDGGPLIRWSKQSNFTALTIHSTFMRDRSSTLSLWVNWKKCESYQSFRLVPVRSLLTSFNLKIRQLLRREPSRVEVGSPQNCFGAVPPTYEHLRCICFISEVDALQNLISSPGPGDLPVFGDSFSLLKENSPRISITSFTCVSNQYPND